MNLAQFALRYPDARLYVIGATVFISAADRAISSGPAGIHTYSRPRDAIRALKRAGYQQEGRYWALKPLKEK